MESIAEKAFKILTKYPLCSRCLGRLFAGLGSGIGNKLRGESLKSLLTMQADASIRMGDNSAYEIIRVLATSGWGPASQLASALRIPFEEKNCLICMNKFTDENIEILAKKVAEAAKEYEFRSFLVGAKVPSYVKMLEEYIYSEYSLPFAESIKKDIDREVGKKLEELLGREVDFNNPEMRIIVDIFTGNVEIKPSPLLIRGYYLKHEVGIPQTPWLCRKCWGAGCPKCNYKGRDYDYSVSEFIGLPAVKLSGAISYEFHAAGREDLDAYVKGEGRPFIVELKEPKRRMIDFKEYSDLVAEYSGGKIEVKELKYASRSDVRLLKTYLEKAKKKYLVIVTFESSINDESIRNLENYFTDRIIDQRTPLRVLSRRADKIRKKRIYKLSAKKIDDFTLSLEMLTDAGLYVKELIHGDSGRTRPSISEFLGIAPKNIKLIILEVVEGKMQQS